MRTHRDAILNLSMFQNYIKVALRSLRRHRFFTIINSVGLAIGMSISLLFIAMLSFIYRYDSFHENKDQIYRAITWIDNGIDRRNFASSPVPLTEKLEQQSAVAKVARIRSNFAADATYANRSIPVQGYLTEPEFFQIFSFPLKKGNAATVLEKPNSIVLTESAAYKIFQGNDPIGQVITMGKWGDFQVTGVMRDPPKNSHFQFEILGSYSTLPASEESWTEFRNNYLYFTIPKKKNATIVETFLAQEANKIYPTAEGVHGGFELQKLSDIAPGRDLYNQIGPDWGYASLTIFGVFTLLILGPACFNYANISVSRALKRAKEIGLRKTVGGQKHQIVFQFITETVVITLFSLILSFGIFSLVRNEFLNMLVSSQGLDLNPDGYTILCFVVFAIIIGVLAGSIPAIYFSRLNPIQALKNHSSIKRQKLSMRKLMIVGQFALSLGFIMSVVIVLQQYRSALKYDLGFEKEGIIDVNLQDVNPSIVKNAFSNSSQIQSISFSSCILGTGGVEPIFIKRNTISDSILAVQMYSDEYYLETLGLRILAGQNFRAGGSSYEILVNEEFVEQVGISTPAGAINETFLLHDTLEVKVVGVLKNFHYAGLSDKIAPFILRYDLSQFTFANIKAPATVLPEVMDYLKENWKNVGGEKKFEARIMNDELEEAYTYYFVMIKICGFLGFLAISISCLGLLGMVVYTTESRTKEIGVRKVMGASSLQIASLLSKGYLYLMLTSASIAVPITYILFDKVLLQTQHYRFQIGIAETIVSILIMFVLGAATIFSQTIKASHTNPVETLRAE